jgi:hypothetical protein
MAAHILTALNQIENDIIKGRLVWDHLRAALEISCWTEDLAYDDYLALHRAVHSEDRIALSFWVTTMKKKYVEMWEALNKPTTREEWNRKRRISYD